MESNRILWWIVNQHHIKACYFWCRNCCNDSLVQQLLKLLVVTDTPSGITTVTTDTPIVIDAASTLSGVSTSDSVGIVTTTDEISGVTTTTTTTSTTSYTYTDVTTSRSTSTSSTTTDGVTTRTDTVTITETTNYETSYDYAAEATRLWDLYEAVNA